MLNIDPDQIQKRRFDRGWSQSELASASGLDVRTIQRIEATGAASLRSKRALATALDLDLADLEMAELEMADHEGGEPETSEPKINEPNMTPCPHCQSERVFESSKLSDTSTIGGELLPKLAPGPFSSAKMRAVVCGDCGFLRYFVDPAARKKVASSKHWKLAS